MAAEHVTVMERLAGAMASDDLSVRETCGDADHLAALGMAMQRRPDGVSAMMRLALVGDKESLVAVVRFAKGLVRRLSIKRGWKLAHQDMERIARKAVEHHYSPTCPECKGRKFRSIKNSPSLSAAPCTQCNGTGLRRFPNRHGKEIAEVVGSMTDQFNLIEHAVKRKLR